MLLGCALRRSEVAALTMGHVQQRDGRWCIVDLVGKHNRVRTVPMPAWVKVAIDAWTGPARVVDGSCSVPSTAATRSRVRCCPKGGLANAPALRGGCWRPWLPYSVFDASAFFLSASKRWIMSLSQSDSAP